jgi:transposase
MWHDQSMRPKGTSEQLAARRQRALELVARGQTITAVAKAIGVSRQTIYDWKKAVRQSKHKRLQRQGGGICQLSPRQLRKLEHELLKGAHAHGYADDHWTLDRIAHQIYDLFGVCYSSSGAWYLMQRLGWSNQRPQRIALERDDGAVVRWQRYVWPKIKKVA